MSAAEPKGFSLDVVMPNKYFLSKSPLRETIMEGGTGYSSGMEDHESTDFSSEQATGSEVENTKIRTEKKHEFILNGMIVSDFMASGDLNECVTAILSKQKAFPEQYKQIIRHNTSSKAKDKQKRFRKNKDQNQILLSQFRRNINWGKETIARLSQELGLKESQVYKWNWDQRKKENLLPMGEEGMDF